MKSVPLIVPQGSEKARNLPKSQWTIDSVYNMTRAMQTRQRAESALPVYDVGFQRGSNCINK